MAGVMTPLLNLECTAKTPHKHFSPTPKPWVGARCDAPTGEVRIDKGGRIIPIKCKRKLRMIPKKRRRSK